MSKLRIGLNGFGRTGRAFTRALLTTGNYELVMINTRKTEPKMLAYLLKYDTVHGQFNKEVSYDENGIIVDDKHILSNLSADIENIPWDKHDIDIVVDSTGAFKWKEQLSKHIKGSVKRVLLTAPSKGEGIANVVLGVNDDITDFENSKIISNCSCTTNCAAPLIKVINDNFDIESAFINSIHAYTYTQNLMDNSNKKFTRARSAVLNIAPSTTGAAKAVVLTIPELKGKIDAMSVRVPVADVSFTDITAVVKKDTNIEEINAAFKTASETNMKGILGYETQELVSSDYIGNPLSVIFDENHTNIIDGKHIKIFGWYDNEWAYIIRVIEILDKVSKFF